MKTHLENIKPSVFLFKVHIHKWFLSANHHYIGENDQDIGETQSLIKSRTIGH
jgi:hypothetical protein